ncbi:MULTISPECIES: TMEM175 family protein [Microbacterium]|uniref:TMEM175 family protein n=1 Tax=Microbacterium TaxID=33882 RepID=UPI000687DC7D|nr:MULTISPECIES: TMEM175 family protein [Microbacterium]
MEPQSESHQARLRSRGVERLVTFTDAVVAIAITLIVLPLVDAAQQDRSEGAGTFFADNALSLFAAALSFVLIASFWKMHHRVYIDVIASTPALINANLLWVAAIAFLPLPTVLVVETSGTTALGSGVYIATILATVVAIRLQKEIIVRRGLRGPDVPAPPTSWTDWLAVPLTVLALIIAVVFPVTSLYPLLLLLLARPISLVVHRGDSNRRTYSQNA